MKNLKRNLFGSFLLTGILFSCGDEKETAPLPEIEDACVTDFSTLYGDGFCDLGCLEPDPDCAKSSSSLNVSSSMVEPLSSVGPLQSSSFELFSSSSLISESSSSEGSSSSGEVILPQEPKTLWEPSMGVQVSEGGFWWYFQDTAMQGESTLSCAGEVQEEAEEISSCLMDEGFDFEYSIVAAVENTWANFGFVVTAFDLYDKKTGTLDARGFQGIEIEYVSDNTVNIQVVRDEEVIEYATHRALMPPADTLLQLPWDSFEQPNWATLKEPLESVLKELTTLKIEAHTDFGEGVSHLKIKRIVLY